MGLQKITLVAKIDGFNDWLDANEFPYFVTPEKVMKSFENTSFPGESLTFRLDGISTYLRDTKSILEVILTVEKDGTFSGSKKWILSVKHNRVTITVEAFSSDGKRISTPQMVEYVKNKFTYSEFASIWSR